MLKTWSLNMGHCPAMQDTMLIFYFHISKEARDKYNFDDTFFSTDGRVIYANFNAARKFAKTINAKRSSDQSFISASDLNAMGLLDEIMHLMIEKYRRDYNERLFERMEKFLHNNFSAGETEKLLYHFSEMFPVPSVYKGETTSEHYLKGTSGELSNRYVLMEELLVLWLDNRNKSYRPIKELIDESPLSENTVYKDVIESLQSFFAAEPRFGQENVSLLEFLQIPAKKYPNSLNDQLEYISRHWRPYLGDLLSRIIISMDFMREEQKARYDKETFGPGPTRVTQFKKIEEYEPEQFSPDLHWMPNVVLLAKSTYVWLHQLSIKYHQPITRLDEIPDAELNLLSQRGFNGLWLIGLWERSKASETIKKIRGNPEAVASAYSLRDYQIAEDLGGESGFLNLKERAWQRGIRLASDMVPNHMGIDSYWLINHPHWFLQTKECPYPQYSYTGIDLCDDDRFSVYIEDGYWNQTDAAVTLKRVDNFTGDTTYIYHGNDGTSMPWNDTAQLNYLLLEVREAVVQTILHVARKFQIIRFDAAMTLAKKHYQRLWFPQPGSGGDIPTRSDYAMTKAEFDQAFPKEFWREVVDRVQQEVPDTLLLAEAFWMMEGYFVRSLGMHRVYNSAFMNMLKNEENAKYRLSIKNVLEFNPQILKRYVNFMNNPDEETAVAQFGKDDKYFGVCILMCTMPGLPMFGHGQIEGFSEKYGMEYKKAYWDEEEDQWLINRHEREIFPLLRRRYLFSDVENFLLYDFYSAEGRVNENVFAYSNRFHDKKGLVIYNNTFAQAAGWIKTSAAFKKDNQFLQQSLGNGLALSNDPLRFVIFRDLINGLEYIRSTRDIHETGLYIELEAFKYQVFIDFREVYHDSSHPYGELCDQLSGKGVPSIEISLKQMIYQPILQAFTESINYEYITQQFENLDKSIDLNALKVDTQKRMMYVLKTVFHFELNQEKPKIAAEKKLYRQWIINLIKMARFILSGKLNNIKLSKKRSQTVENVLLITTNQIHFTTLFLVPYILTLYRFYSEKFNYTDASYLSDRLFDLEIKKIFKRMDLDDYNTDITLLLYRILVRFDFILSDMNSQDIQAYFRKFFNNEDVQNYLIFNNYENTIYFNRERFEYLLSIHFICHLLSSTGNKKIETVMRSQTMKNEIDRLAKYKNLALQTGYKVHSFLQALENNYNQDVNKGSN
ncbi:MAG: alpha-amylase [Caldithrix sp.]|nr:alpha-amylase [Caldithrix sp.]